MDIGYIDDIEKKVNEIIIHDFMEQEYADKKEDHGKSYSMIPPGLINEVLSSLVIPVVTALITEYLTKKIFSDHREDSAEICERAQHLNTEATEVIEDRSEEILPDDEEPDSIYQNVSAKLKIEIDIRSAEDVEKLVSYLEQYLHHDIDS